MAHFLITFMPVYGHDEVRPPEVVEADDVHASSGDVILSSWRGIEAIYPACLGVSARRVPDESEDGTLARMWRALRWAATS